VVVEVKEIIDGHEASDKDCEYDIPILYKFTIINSIEMMGTNGQDSLLTINTLTAITAKLTTN
jgi:hypothetical protein